VAAWSDQVIPSSYPGDTGSWLNALRARGQNWTVILGLVPFGTPGGAIEAFNNTVIANAGSLNVSCFARLTPEQITAIRDAPNQLSNLYIWVSGTRYGTHPSSLTYDLESPAWAASINAALAL
jgi:hypothetical protein